MIESRKIPAALLRSATPATPPSPAPGHSRPRPAQAQASHGPADSGGLAGWPGDLVPLPTQRDWSSTWATRTLPPLCAPFSTVGMAARTAPNGEFWRAGGW